MSATIRVGRVTCVEIEAKSILNRVRDMPFAWSINPYRGCYHQCVFCYARRTHTFLERDGLGDWGSMLSVKINAPQIVRRELANPRWKGEHVAIGTATDPYQPLEGRYRITRGILIELARARTDAHLITRSPLVVRDIDVLQDLARAAGASVCISLPTLDPDLARKIEPTVAPPRQRLRAVRMLADAGIRVGVAVAPILPELTDTEAQLREVFAAAAEAGASMAWHSVLNLNDVARASYFEFLRAEFPSLVASHENYYRRKYAPIALADRIAERVRLARETVRLRPRATIAAQPHREQLSLF
ncbi:MAG: radical SAM protein [Candidatus Eremiobacteraeota bacterium]|nr:radical SAM protein [Candidatus Eremiobacteraeota bacterium]